VEADQEVDSDERLKEESERDRGFQTEVVVPVRHILVAHVAAQSSVVVAAAAAAEAAVDPPDHAFPAASVARNYV
jgi:hypothetical protein